jgi:hypothetical protein
MARPVVTAIVLGIAILASVSAVAAHQCPALIRRIHAAADIRFDQRAYDAKAKAVEAARLHAEGRHDDAEKVALEGCALVGITCLPHSTR